MRRAGFVALGLLAGALAAAPSDPVVSSLLLFAGNAQGLWRSSDWGATWQPVDRGPVASLGAARAIVPLGPRVWVGGAGGLFVSDDFGLTWARRSTLADVHSLLTSRWPEADPTVFAGTGAGLMKSTDRGETFSATPVTGLVSGLAWPGPVLAVSGEAGLRLSDDGAASLRPVGTGLPEGPVASMVLSGYFAADPVLFVGPRAGGLYKSTDGGRSFRLAGLEGRQVKDLAWLGPLLYVAADDGLHRSEDGARRFERLGIGLDGRELRRLFFPHAPGSAAELFVATDDGVFHSADGGARFERAGLRGQAVDLLATFPPIEPVYRKRRK